VKHVPIENNDGFNGEKIVHINGTSEGGTSEGGTSEGGNALKVPALNSSNLHTRRLLSSFALSYNMHRPTKSA